MNLEKFIQLLHDVKLKILICYRHHYAWSAKETFLRDSLVIVNYCLLKKFFLSTKCIVMFKESLNLLSHHNVLPKSNLTDRVW